MHILWLDDVQLARQIAPALTEAGHDATIVHDGERALDKQNRNRSI
jgi:DNA-binding response OmpR family regulator